MSKHTPGPWKVIQAGDPFNVPRIIAERGGVAVVCVNRYMGEKGPSAEESANARLIAAAPDLLAALKIAYFELNAIHARDGVPYTSDGWKSGVDQAYFSSVVEQARAAIAKAEGA
jgi:hypothetical protein